MPRVYLDHASTSTPRPAVVDALIAALGLADPGRVHTEGRIARATLEQAREKVARFCGTRSRQVIFTSGATEAINAAIYGAITSGRGDHIVCSGVEHSAVRRASERAGRVSVTAVDHEGRIDPEALLAAIGPNTALVHCQWANHEVGTIQPVAQIVAACRERGVLVHVDAAAAAGHLPLSFDELGADLLSISAHKLGGPKGAGALLVRRGVRLPPFLVGGEQERARRGGLEDVPAWVGFGAAAEAMSDEPANDAGDQRGNEAGDQSGDQSGSEDGTEAVGKSGADLAGELAGDLAGGLAGGRGGLLREAQRARGQTDRIRAAALALPGVRVFGPIAELDRLPNLICLGIDGVEAEAVLIGLDQAGIAAHSGSACSSESLEPSPVLAAMGVDAEHSLRLSVGWSTTRGDIDAALLALPRVIGDLRALRQVILP
jgi:cysteine desulfurase